MPQYMFLIYGDENAFGAEPPPPEVWQEMLAQHQAFMAGVQSGGGQILGGEALGPTTAATTVRHQDGEVLLTDGPFAETKETLGGYYLVEAADLEQALAFAAKVPTSGCVEVRPVVPTGGQ